MIWTGDLPANANFNLSFQATINPGTPVGTVIPNRARFERTAAPGFTFLSNEVTVTVVGPALTATKTSPTTSARPGQVITFDVQVQNTGTAPADNVVVRDPLPSNATYVPG